MKSSDENAGEPVVLRAASRPLFGIHNSPAGPVQRSVGVVLCNPVGYDSLSVYRAYRHLAESLALRGFHTLRFDYYGLGNSAEASDQAGDCSEDVAAAIEDLKERSGVERVILFGVRSGALFALDAATQRSDVAGLALWATPTSGRAHLRELVAFQRLSGVPTEGSEVRIAGFLLSDALQAKLKTIDATVASSGRRTEILALCRDDVPADAKLADGWSKAGHEVFVDNAPGYAEMMTWTEVSVVPTRAVETICEWAGRTQEALESRRVSSFHIVPRTDARAEVARDVAEEGVRFGAKGRLFGVLSTPTDRPAKKLAILVGNTGANHHIGAGRFSVTLARSLAASGYPVLRFDASGLGESRATGGRGENFLYDDSAAVDASEALRFLEGKLGVSNFMLVGICAGAYMAFRCALNEPLVRALVLVNQAIFERSAAAQFTGRVGDSFKSRKAYVDAIFNPETWTRLVAGNVAVGPVVRHLGMQAYREMRTRSQLAYDRLSGRDERRNPVELEFGTLSRRGTKTLMIHGDEDPSLDTMSLLLGTNAERMAGDPNFSHRLVANADHVFIRQGAQQRLLSLVESFVSETSSRV